MGELARTGVVVLNWNGRSHLESCLPTLVDPGHPDLFVIVVDNGSRDGSVEWVRENHPDVEVVALEENRRFAGGNNAGADRALERGAEIVVLLNNDTFAEAGLFAELARAFEREPRVGVVGPRIVHADRPERIWYGGGVFRPRWGWVSHRALRAPIGAGRDPEGPTDWVTGCCLAVRAELWRELGGLDEAFYIYAEDVDFCLRARERGWSAWYRPQAVLRHAVSASVGGHGSAFKSYHRTRARQQLLERHGVGRLWPLATGLADLAQVLWQLASGSPAGARAVVQAWIDRGRPARYRAEDLRT